jgi:aspartate 1-decarboxylase
MFKSKIQRATVTDAELFYEGSITIDKKLMDAADILPHEKVQVVNVNNGARLETYTIAAEEGSGEVKLNGPAARLGLKGDRIIVISYAAVSDEELPNFVSKVVQVNEKNEIVEVK